MESGELTSLWPRSLTPLTIRHSSHPKLLIHTQLDGKNDVTYNGDGCCIRRLNVSTMMVTETAVVDSAL
ncbi:hypothetical protein J6590_084581 [Homalodisca vitripennis]|nr:hypothetical protein J6590_084581 [Homalodisca vitripennis]